MNTFNKRDKVFWRQGIRILEIEDQLNNIEREQFILELDNAPKYTYPIANVWETIHRWEYLINHC